MKKRTSSVSIAASVGILCFGVSGVAVGSLVGASSEDSKVAIDEHSGRGAIPQGWIVPPGQPCPGAVHEEDAGRLETGDQPRLFVVPVSIPDRAVATAQDAWTCGETASVPVIMYPGVQVSFEPGWEDVDGPSKFADMVRERGGQVLDLDGIPAYVNDGDATMGTTSTVALLSPRGILINIDAVDDRSSQALVPIARSLATEEQKISS